MSPRPRTVSDERILAATGRAITRLGPARLTLADIAADVGLSPGALVQRFGSKRRLLLAFVRHGAGMADDSFLAARAAHASPLAALRALAMDTARRVRTAAELVNHLAILQMDLSDPAFRRHAREQSRQTLAGYEALLRDAIAAGEIVPCEVPRVARALQALVNGSLFTWAISRDGPVAPFVRTDIDTFLMPLRITRTAG